MEKEKFDKVKYNTKYTESHYERFTYRVRNDNTKVIEKLRSVPSVAAYITELIERDLNEEK